MSPNNAKICIVVTTINTGEFLDDYCTQADAEGVRDRLRVVVIPDRKTPPELYQRCAQLAKRGFDVLCPTLSEQENYLEKFGKFGSLVPYDSDNRRNIGFLMALEWGCQVLLSIDDDNYCVGPTYDTIAQVCGDSVTLPAVYSSDGWFNMCELLETEPNYRVYPRGFPYHKRHKVSELTFREEGGTVRLNAGLWLQDPDLDAITWLAAPVRASKFRGKSLLLGEDVWSPINTQNTALHRDLVVGYYFVRMGYPLAGMPIDRYGDIFSGYLVQACIRHMGHRIRIGTPVADHRRNSHNHMRDLAGELACIFVLEDFLAWLPTARLEGKTYCETYLSLADAIDDQVERFDGSIWTEATRGFFHQMGYCMRQWTSACRQIG
jgi:Reversibly glycosylated polypeptide